ncbi:hypothetical protein Pmani_000583 [Petrolisthes manimaculis]|uniref:Uncharacterized protein n=1 Tax=Petrolisthes manimaculis TaxID=1843537 RepID=A0AAE1QLS2_9EUCA|nr:hypothetical protein Pmani_000583 [Petrolisthes manimaculis]
MAGESRPCSPCSGKDGGGGGSGGGGRQALRRRLGQVNRRLRSVFSFSRSYYGQYMRYRVLKVRWINNCVVNFM